MFRFLARAALGALLTGSAFGAVIASVDASAFDVECGTSCGDFDSQLGQTTASASYSNPNGGSASANATVGGTVNGGLILKAFATATGGGGNGSFTANRGAASAYWQDRIHFTGTALDVFLDLTFELTGSRSGDAVMSAEASACDVVSTGCGITSLSGPGTLLLNGPVPVDPQAFSWDLILSLSVNATGHATGGPSSSTADFSHTLTLVRITPRDSLGNFVNGLTLTSDSGFDYSPYLGPSAAVPEPGTMCLMGPALLAGFVWIRRQRRS